MKLNQFSNFWYHFIEFNPNGIKEICFDIFFFRVDDVVTGKYILFPNLERTLAISDEDDLQLLNSLVLSNTFHKSIRGYFHNTFLPTQSRCRFFSSIIQSFFRCLRTGINLINCLSYLIGYLWIFWYVRSRMAIGDQRD